MMRKRCFTCNKRFVNEYYLCSDGRKRCFACAERWACDEELNFLEKDQMRKEYHGAIDELEYKFIYP